LPLGFILDNITNEVKLFDFEDKIAAVREDKVEYKYCSPFNKVENYESDGERFYGLIRIVPEVDVEFRRGEFYFNKIEFKVFDAAASILNERQILSVYVEGINANRDTLNFHYNWIEDSIED